MSERDAQPLSVTQAATALDLHRSRIQALCSQGRIKGAVQIGKRWVIPSPPVVLPPQRENNLGNSNAAARIRNALIARKKSAQKTLTAERLRELFHYDESTGVFTRLVAKPNSPKKGAASGCNDGNGYLRIRIDWQLYFSHRLAWLYVYGEWPTKDLDHVNGYKSDNRIANLREATRSQNECNTNLRRNNTSGFKGVTWNKACGKWQAQIKGNGKYHNLGLFTDLFKAAEAYDAAALQMHGQFAKPNSQISRDD